MITGPQCRAARALVELTRERLAQLSGINAETIEHFERKIGSRLMNRSSFCKIRSKSRRAVHLGEWWRNWRPAEIQPLGSKAYRKHGK